MRESGASIEYKLKSRPVRRRGKFFAKQCFGQTHNRRQIAQRNKLNDLIPIPRGLTRSHPFEWGSVFFIGAFEMRVTAKIIPGLRTNLRSGGFAFADDANGNRYFVHCNEFRELFADSVF